MFGDVIIGLHSVLGFNDELSPIWSNPEPPERDGTIVLFDHSASMLDHASVAKLIASALKCCSGTQGKWNLPAPSCGTALVDAVDAVHAGDYANVTKVIVVTDGVDTVSKATELIKATLADGTFERIPFAKDWPSDSLPGTMTPNEHRRAFYREKNEQVATHISNLNFETVVVAIGSEVKGFVAALCKPGRRVNVAHIASNATAATVARQMRAVTRRPRRAANDTVAAPVVDESVVAAETEALDVADLAAIENEAAITTIAVRGEPFVYDPVAMLQSIDTAVQASADRFSQDARHVREAFVAYARLLAALDEPLAGPILLSKFGGVFKDPVDDAGKQSSFKPCLNALFSALAALDGDGARTGPALVATKKDNSFTLIDAATLTAIGYATTAPMQFKFGKTPHYTLHPAFALVLDAFVREADASADWPTGADKTLELWKGNSKVETAVVVVPAPTAGDGGGSSSSSSGGGGTKRSRAELETENKTLKDENDALKAKLARVQAACA